MKLFLRIAASLFFALASMHAAMAARPGAPMEQFLNNPIKSGSGATLTNEQVEAAMVRGGVQHDWVITPNHDGTLNAHLDVRNGKHTLDVVITLHDNQYDITYKNSTNLQYAPKRVDADAPLIHPAYSKWLKTLIKDFNIQFTTL